MRDATVGPGGARMRWVEVSGGEPVWVYLHGLGALSAPYFVPVATRPGVSAVAGRRSAARPARRRSSARPGRRLPCAAYGPLPLRGELEMARDLAEMTTGQLRQEAERAGIGNTDQMT